MRGMSGIERKAVHSEKNNRDWYVADKNRETSGEKISYGVDKLEESITLGKEEK